MVRIKGEGGNKRGRNERGGRGRKRGNRIGREENGSRRKRKTRRKKRRKRRRKRWRKRRKKRTRSDTSSSSIAESAFGHFTERIDLFLFPLQHRLFDSFIHLKRSNFVLVLPRFLLTQHRKPAFINS